MRRNLLKTHSLKDTARDGSDGDTAPTESTCIFIVEQNYESRRLYTGTVVQGFEVIEKLAAGRSSYVDDGLYPYKLNPETGELLSQKRLAR